MWWIAGSHLHKFQLIRLRRIMLHQLQIAERLQMPANPNLWNEEPGLLRRGWIDSYDPSTNLLKVKLNNAPMTSNNPAISVPATSFFYNNGLFMGSLPVPGTPVVVGQGSGGQYY